MRFPKCGSSCQKCENQCPKTSNSKKIQKFKIQVYQPQHLRQTYFTPQNQVNSIENEPATAVSKIGPKWAKMPFSDKIAPTQAMGGYGTKVTMPQDLPHGQTSTHGTRSGIPDLTVSAFVQIYRDSLLKGKRQEKLSDPSDVEVTIFTPCGPLDISA